MSLYVLHCRPFFLWLWKLPLADEIRLGGSTPAGSGGKPPNGGESQLSSPNEALDTGSLEDLRNEAAPWGQEVGCNIQCHS